MSFIVFNHTDGITASCEDFATKKEAEAFILSFRKRYDKQGYYRTSNWDKIAPSEIDLEIKEVC